jgi:acylphosphatase
LWDLEAVFGDDYTGRLPNCWISVTPHTHFHVNAARNQRRRIVYSGHVQGVGFRFNAANVSRGFAVTGYVRNLADGRVELVAEGAVGELNGFQAAIAESMSGFIRDTNCQDLAPSGEFASFEVRY